MRNADAKESPTHGGGMKLPISFAPEERFDVSINIVRQLSEGRLNRDPQAKVIKAPQPPKLVVLPPPVTRETNFVRHYNDYTKWVMLKQEASGKTREQVLADLAAKKKAWRAKRRALAA